MSGSRRDRILLLGRLGFVVLAGLLAWWGFRGRWDEVGTALRGTGPGTLAGATGLAGAGVVLTSLLWRRLVLGLGAPVSRRDAAAVFLVGQLGKYVPGSVWSFAAQARLGRDHQIPARSSLAASSVFLLLHTSTGIVLGATTAATGLLPADGPRWLWGLVALAGAAGVAPPFVRFLGARIAGRDVTARFTTADLAVAAVTMAAVWLVYGAAVLLLVDGTGPAAAIGAFALSHAAGVLLVLAPAGLGAREGVLVALLAPAVGVAPAAAAALLARVVHTLADFITAAFAWAVARRPPIPAPAAVPRRGGAT